MADEAVEPEQPTIERTPSLYLLSRLLTTLGKFRTASFQGAARKAIRELDVNSPESSPRKELFPSLPSREKGIWWLRRDHRPASAAPSVKLFLGRQCF
jgi:hypothetical protein